MGEADRDQQLAPVPGGELDRDMAAEGRRRPADVDGDIEDAAAPHADELVLGEGRDLEVQPAQSAGGGGKGVVVLDELKVEAERRKG